MTGADKGSRKNNFPCLGVDPSRLAAWLVLSIRGVCAVLEPCQTGVSAPKHEKLFLREPLGFLQLHHTATRRQPVIMNMRSHYAD